MQTFLHFFFVFLIFLQFSLFFFNSLLCSATSQRFCFCFSTHFLTCFSSILLKSSTLIGFCSKMELSNLIVSLLSGFSPKEISSCFLSLYILKMMWKLQFLNQNHEVQLSNIFLGIHYSKRIEKCSYNSVNCSQNLCNYYYFLSKNHECNTFGCNTFLPFR